MAGIALAAFENLRLQNSIPLLGSSQITTTTCFPSRPITSSKANIWYFLFCSNRSPNPPKALPHRHNYDSLSEDGLPGMINTPLKNDRHTKTIPKNRAGSKFGGGGVASHSATNADRRERLRKLALETIDLDKDPYFFKNHVGSFECRLCLTVHQNDGSYLAHTQGRKHQTNLARRAAREQKEGRAGQDAIPMAGVQVRRNTVKIGRPGYKITKTRDPLTRQMGLLFQLQYPEITPGAVPRVRFMSAFEQKVDDPPDKNYQYLLVAAEPYETCGFKLQAREVDRREGRFWTWFDEDSKEFFVQVLFKTEREERYSGVPGLAPSGPRR